MPDRVPIAGAQHEKLLAKIKPVLLLSISYLLVLSR